MLKQMKWMTLAVVYLVLLWCVGAMAADSGSDGNITWTLNDITFTLDDNGVLTVSGNGPTGNYISPVELENYAPWRSKDVREVVFGSGITEISDSVFERTYSLQSAIIPGNVVSICDYAFSGCHCLSNVTIQYGVTSIGRSAFGASALTSIVIPDSVTSIGPYAFSRTIDGEEDVYDVVIYGSVGSYAETYANENGYEFMPLVNTISSGEWGNLSWMLDENGQLTISGTGHMAGSEMEEFPWSEYADFVTVVVIESGVQSISSWSFMGFTELTDVTLPNSLNSIGDYAFEDCTSLGSITIPDSVESIWMGAFANCTSLCDIVLSSNVEFIDCEAFLSCSSLFSITIPDSVTYIGDHAFAYSGLTSITIPESVTGIGDNAFCGCTGLRQAILPDLPSDAFEGDVFCECVNLETINVPYCDTYVPEAWCNVGTDLIQYELVFSEHREVVTDEAVDPTCAEEGYTEGSHCEACGEVMVTQEEVPALGHDWGEPVYTWNEDNTAVTATHVCGNDAGHVETETVDTTSVITLEPTSTEMGETTYTSKPFTNEAFTVQTKTVANISPTAPAIVASGECGASGDNLTWKLDDEGVLTISGNGPMEDYLPYTGGPWGSGVTSVLLPDGITRIGNYAFFLNTALTDVTLPDSLVSIGTMAFIYCENLTDIFVAEGNPAYRSVDGVLFSKDLSILVYYPNGKSGTYAIPEGTTTIYWSTFGYNDKLTSITIPNSMTDIGNKFNNCHQFREFIVSSSHPTLSSVNGVLFDKNTTTLIACPVAFPESEYVIPQGILNIGPDAFNQCKYINSIRIPEGVISIDAMAFFWCSLTNITIPDSVTSIAGNAFTGCESLTDVYYTGTETQWGEINISGGNDLLSSANIHYNYIPTAHANGTCGANGDNLTWSLDSDGVLTISGNGTMANYEYGTSPWYSYAHSVISLIIEENVTSVGDYAFSNCSNLNSTIISDSVTHIGTNAFLECNKLTSLTISAGVTSLGYAPFSPCTSLTHFIVDGKNPAFTSRDGVLYSKDMSVLVDFPSGKAGSYLIPDGVVSIRHGAFQDSGKLTSLTIPDTVGDMFSNQFSSGCDHFTTFIVSPNHPSLAVVNGLLINKTDMRLICCPAALEISELEIPQGIQNIGGDAFTSCGNLTSVVIPDSVANISGWAFCNCNNLTSITIPKSVRSIGYGAFMFSNSISNVYYGGTEAQWNTISIEGDNDSLFDATIHFRPISNILTLPDSLNAIESEAFTGLLNVDAIRIPASIVSIATDAFDPGMTLLVPSQSWALWAEDHGYTAIVD